MMLFDSMVVYFISPITKLLLSLIFQQQQWNKGIVNKERPSNQLSEVHA